MHCDFVQFRPYATSFMGLFLSLTVISRSKKTLEMSLDLTPSFKTSVDARVEGLVSNVDYLKNWHRILFKRNSEEKRRLPRTQASFSGLQFFFLYGFLHR